MSPEVRDLPAVTPPQAAIRFDRVGISKFSLEEGTTSPGEVSDAAHAPLGDIQFEASIVVHQPLQADVTLSIKIVSVPGGAPYNISMDLVGSFAGQGDVTHEGFVQFCQTTAPTIMFPYVRQAVNEITSNGRFGAVRLPLLNLNAILLKGAWTVTPHLQS